MANEDIRNYAKAQKVPYWKIANYMNVCEMTISRKLRFELTQEEKKEYRRIIDEIAYAESKKKKERM